MEATPPDHTRPKDATAFFSDAAKRIVAEMRQLEAEHEELRVKLIEAGVELQRRPKLEDVLMVVELEAARAPTLTEGDALRRLASKLRAKYREMRGGQ
jgi:hypothetical protein